MMCASLVLVFPMSRSECHHLALDVCVCEGVRRCVSEVRLQVSLSLSAGL